MGSHFVGGKSVRVLWGSVGKFLALPLVLTMLAACGGGGGDSSPPPPPSGSISYASSTQSFTVGTAITAINPTITGTLSGFTISPALPAGLSLDSSKGTISGTPTAVTAVTNYTVSAVISGGTTTSGSISIAVNDVPPSQLSYGAPSFTFSSMVASSTLTPTTAGGAVVGWSISPALPAGLDFSTTDGSISGTPMATAASSSYVITAQNSGGQTSVTLTIEVDVAPLINLGHQAGVVSVGATATNVFSVDARGFWILWNYTGTSIVASGNSGCAQTPTEPQGCRLAPASGIAGSTAAIVTPTGLEFYSTSDGHTLGSITTSANWWRLATDGSYIAAGNSTNLSAWSSSGQLLFSRPGDYSKAVSFAGPNQILVAAGAAGQNVVEAVAVPSGTSTTGPQFNGQFASWFTDGGRFITSAGTTALVYSNSSVQQASFTVPANGQVVGQGNWVWMQTNSAIVIYPATGTNPAAAASYAFSIDAAPAASGTTLAVVVPSSTSISVIDLSGSTPVKTDYAPSVPMYGVTFAAVSASQWVVGNQNGVLLDGASLGGTPRFFGFGQVYGIAGGTAHFAIATASGNILYFSSTTLAQEGHIAFFAAKVAASADGSLLVAQGGQGGLTITSGPVAVYDLPAGTPLSNPATGVEDIVLSGSGTVLGLDLGSGNTMTQEAEAPTGGSVIFSSTVSSPTWFWPPPIRISPDGTLVAVSQLGSPVLAMSTQTAGTNLLLNGTLVTAFTGVPVGWLDNTRLVVNNYDIAMNHISMQYTGCTIYGANGNPTGGACALPKELTQFQPVASDAIYVPTINQVWSVSTGTVNWASGDSDTLTLGPLNSAAAPTAAVAGSHVIFVSGTNLVAQSY